MNNTELFLGIDRCAEKYMEFYFGYTSHQQECKKFMNVVKNYIRLYPGTVNDLIDNALNYFIVQYSINKSKQRKYKALVNRIKYDIFNGVIQEFK